MGDIRRFVRFLITAQQTYKLLILAGIFASLIKYPSSASAQGPDPESSINMLKEGYLVVRIPTYSPKIDTLKALIARSDEPNQKAKLEKELQKTIEERDTLLSDYINAFRHHYNFSKVAYILDHDSRNLNTATYYNLEGEHLAIADLSEGPLFYLFFERSSEMKIDALAVYDRNLKKIPKPFPNDFSISGFNGLIISITGKSIPDWRVSRMNKRYKMYWDKMNYKE